jgi:hypothetical protein
MLNSHPELAVPHETLFLVDAYRKRRKWGDMADPANRHKLAWWVANRGRGRSDRLARDKERLIERMVAAEPTLGSVLAVPFAFYAERNGKPRWGDKRPSHIHNLDALFAMFPDAQYVNIVRDPRAAVASIRRINKERPLWFQDPVVSGTEVWQRAERNAKRWSKRLRDDQFHELRYEDLIADPAGTLTTLAAFLELDPAGVDSMLAFHEDADVEAPKMHPLVAQPLTTEAVRKWESELVREDVAFIERTLEREMAERGYEPVASGTKVPKTFAKRLRRRRKRIRRNRMEQWMFERWRHATYRHAIAAASSSAIPVALVAAGA